MTTITKTSQIGERTITTTVSDEDPNEALRLFLLLNPIQIKIDEKGNHAFE